MTRHKKFRLDARSCGEQPASGCRLVVAAVHALFLRDIPAGSDVYTWIPRWGHEMSMRDRVSAGAKQVEAAGAEAAADRLATSGESTAFVHPDSLRPTDIFAFDTLTVDLRTLLKTFVVVLLSLGVVDACLWLTDPFKLRSGWEHPWIDSKIAGARRIYREYGRIDAMVLGNSVGLTMDAGLWQEACGGKRVFYNAALAGGTPGFARLLFEKVYYPELKPKRLIYVATIAVLTGPTASPYFDTVMARRLTATSLKEKTLGTLEEYSYLFRSRRHLRRLITAGGIPVETHFLHDRLGSNYPAVQRITAADVARGIYAQRYSWQGQFVAQMDGEYGELMKLGEFCRTNGVEFVLVSQPVAPASTQYSKAPAKDMAAYKAALENYRKSGLRVIDIDDAGSVPDAWFADPMHPNRWGSYHFSDFVYRQVIRPWFPADAIVAALPQSFQLDVYRLVPSSETRCVVENRYLTHGNDLAAVLQIAAREPGLVINMGDAQIPPGDYTFDLYGADERTSPTAPHPPGHVLAYKIQGSDSSQREQEFEMSRDDVLRATLTRQELHLDTTSSVALAIKKLNGPECVLDSLFIRRKAAPGVDAMPPLANVFANARLPIPMLVSNGSFEFEDLRKTKLPAGWKPYSPDGKVHGEYKLSSEAEQGKRSLEVRLLPEAGRQFAAIGYDVPSSALKFVRGKNVMVRVWVKSASKGALGSIIMKTDRWSDVKMPPYATPGKWQELQVRGRVPETASAVGLLLGAASDTPVLYDDVRLQVEGETGIPIADDAGVLASGREKDPAGSRD